jgi:superfamily I DNA/RNA helicase/mRNA-degrading endonuclease RelE of RelBE toxin-antitoxin system
MPNIPVKVAISQDFLSAFSKIQKQRQNRVLDFVNKFRSDPTRPGINYEKIKKAKDPNLRSVRIDDTYRGIVFKPDSGNVFVLMWIDIHDKAYAWGENKICQVHPELGSLQVFDVEHVAPQLPQVGTTTEKPAKGLFSDIKDADMLKLGVPDALFNLVRSIGSEEELDSLGDQLPEEAYEALGFLAVGLSLEEVIRDMERPEPEKPVDTDDYFGALDNEDSKRRFYVVDDELELASVLNAPLENWRVFLHPKQRKIVERDWNGPVRVLGGAGTGKTVAAMHRAKWLLENRFTDRNDRILFTTFTKNLAADIQQNLSKICSAETMKRIEVVNLDRWVSNFLNKQGYQSVIDYGANSASLWEKALEASPGDLEVPESFYREEWEEVIQPLGITTLEEYMFAPRVGRGVRLNRNAREDVWPVFEEYRFLMTQNRLKEPEDAMRDAALIISGNRGGVSYRSVIVDEAQDMGLQAFSLIRQMVPESQGKNDIFIVGDGHQRIYRRKVVLGRAGIKITGRSKKLLINYRTTEENRNWAVRILEGLPIDDLDGNLDNQKGYKSLMHGQVPQIANFSSFDDEVSFIARYLGRLTEETTSIRDACLVTRNRHLIDQYESALNQKGIKTYRLSRNQAEDRNHPGLRLATMHRVKGLEFENIIIAAANDNVIPEPKMFRDASDQNSQKDIDVRERSLLYVAATRAKKEVVVTSFGKMSRYLTNITGCSSGHQPVLPELSDGTGKP